MELELGGTGSELSKMVSFDSRGFEPADSATTVLVIQHAAIKQMHGSVRYDGYCTIRRSSLHLAPSLISSVLVADTSGKMGGGRDWIEWVESRRRHD